MTEDARLLRHYAVNGSEAAFAELVERHANLVYSVALRGVNGDAHLARDVAQVVFTDLARRAGSLSEHTVLGGWLHRHTFFTAAKAVRAQRRRHAREQVAVAMQNLNDDAEGAWRQLAPVLDEAMSRLGGREGNAIVLRFFEDRPFRAVGEALGVSEDTARKRVERALAVLRTLLVRRGVVLPAAVLAATLGTRAISAAPVGLALQLAQTSTIAAAASTTGGTFASLLNFFAMTKLQTSVLGLLFLAGTATPLLFNSQSTSLRKDTDPAPLGLADVQSNDRTNESAGRRSNMHRPARPGSSALAQLESWLLNEDQRNPTSGGMDDELRFRIWSLAATDYSLAWTLRDRLRSEAVRSKFQNEMLRYWAQLDPPSAMAAVQQMPAGRARQQAEDQVLSRWGEKEPSAAVKWARESMPENLRTSRVAWAIDGMARRDPRAAAALLAKLPDGLARSRAMHTILTQWAERDPAATALYLAQMPVGTTRNRGRRALAASWVKQDVKAAAEWVQSFPSATERVGLLTGMGLSLAETQPANVGFLLTAFQSDLERLSAPRPEPVVAIFRRWSATDTAGALEWAQKLPPGSLRDMALDEVKGPEDSAVIDLKMKRR